MKTIVSDKYGKIRVIDLWNNKVLSISGGNEDGESDREWSIGTFLTLDSENENEDNVKNIYALHDNGKCSHFILEINRNDELETTLNRESVFDIGKPSKAYCFSKYTDGDTEKFIACYKDYIAVFTDKDNINVFDTVEGSCAATYNDKALYGRIDQPTVCYDINTQSKVWESSPAPKDELGIVIKDRDRSLYFINENLIVVGQSTGLVLYDMSKGTDAIYRVKDVFEYPVVCINSIMNATFVEKNPNKHCFVCGDTTGTICSYVYDPDDKHLLRRSFGFVGSVAGSLCFNRTYYEDLLFVLTNQRTLLMFDTKTRFLTKTAFTKTHPTYFFPLDTVKPLVQEDDLWNMPESVDNTVDWDENYVPEPKKKIKN